MEKEIEKAIKETLVITNPQSIHRAVAKISKLFTDKMSFYCDDHHHNHEGRMKCVKQCEGCKVKNV